MLQQPQQATVGLQLQLLGARRHNTSWLFGLASEQISEQAVLQQHAATSPANYEVQTSASKVLHWQACQKYARNFLETLHRQRGARL